MQRQRDWTVVRTSDVESGNGLWVMKGWFRQNFFIFLAYQPTPVKQTKPKKKQKECSDLENHAKEVDREMERMMSSMSRGFEKMFGFKD